MYAPLSASSTTWYWSKDGNIFRLRGWPHASILAESNGSLPPEWLINSPASWLLVHRDQLRARPTLDLYRLLYAQKVLRKMKNLGELDAMLAAAELLILMFQACISTVNDTWEWLESSARCLSTHLHNAAEYHKVNSKQTFVCLFVYFISVTAQCI